MGLGFATLSDPARDDQGDVLGRLFFFMALASFLLVNGHEAVVTAVLRSFEHVPAGTFSVDTGVLALVSGMLLSAMEVSLRVALPVIATDAGGLPELLGAHAGHLSTGNLVPAANPRALARALYETLADLPAARARAELARQRALTTFTATAMVEATVAVYQELRARG